MFTFPKSGTALLATAVSSAALALIPATVATAAEGPPSPSAIVATVLKELPNFCKEVVQGPDKSVIATGCDSIQPGPVRDFTVMEDPGRTNSALSAKCAQGQATSEGGDTVSVKGDNCEFDRLRVEHHGGTLSPLPAHEAGLTPQVTWGNVWDKILHEGKLSLLG